jgi:type II secretion system protein H
MNIFGENLELRTKDKQSGFTLIEVLLVVLVISLIAGVGGGIYTGTYKGLLVEKAARNFLLTAKYARIMAIEQQKRYELNLDVSGNRFYLTTMELNEETSQAGRVIVRDAYCKPVLFEGDVRFEDIKITPIGVETTEKDEEEEQQIVFLPNGTAQKALIQIGDDKTHYAICISAATGKAKLFYSNIESVKVDTIDLDAQ